MSSRAILYPPTRRVNQDIVLYYGAVDRFVPSKRGGANLSGQGLTWTYDSFGNRTTQGVVGGVLQQYAAHASYNNSNQAISTNLAGSVSYDEAGNVLNDGVNSYGIDAESRICAFHDSTLNETWTSVYDAGGHRVAKGQVSTGLSCFTGTGFNPAETDVLGQNGEQFSTLAPAGWQRTNVYANGRLLATYEGSSVYFALNDWRGDKRVLANGIGQTVAVSQNLPFGDGFTVTGSPDASDHHLTGQLHDTQSGLDFFGARFYSSAMGRFLSPDWSDDPDPIPWANINNPQSLNLYAYVGNNPLSDVDDDGHDGAAPAQTCTIWCWLRNLFKPGGGSGGNSTPLPPGVYRTATSDFMEGAGKGIGNTLTSAANSIDKMVGNPQHPLEPINGDWQKRGAMVGGIGMFFIPGPDEIEGLQLAEKWVPGTFESIGESLSYHFEKHGAELGAESLLQYLRKADQFAANLQRSKSIPLGDGAVKYIKNGRFLTRSIEGKILSFGLVGQ